MFNIIQKISDLYRNNDDEVQIYEPHQILKFLGYKDKKTALEAAELAKARHNKIEKAFNMINKYHNFNISKTLLKQGLIEINGKKGIKPDYLLPLLIEHPEFEDITEYYQNNTAVCKIKRQDRPQYIKECSVQDALKEGLITKSEASTPYIKTLLIKKARSCALSEVFWDIIQELASNIQIGGNNG